MAVKRYFIYLAFLYLKNFLVLLGGLSLAFAVIDYFQYAKEIESSSNIHILYMFYMWQEALSLLYPLALIFALIMTKIGLIKNNTMGILHAFGYSSKRLFVPFLVVASIVYMIFVGLHTTQFSYAKDKAKSLLAKQYNSHAVNNLFFKYNDTFVYINTLNPVKKHITDMTIFKVTNQQIAYTMHADEALYNDKDWDANDVTLRIHHYKDGNLTHYSTIKVPHMVTLEGYRPKVIESLYEGKALTITDAYQTWQILSSQGINSDKIRSAIYEKIIFPLFAFGMMTLLFFRMPIYARFANISRLIAVTLGVTFLIWGLFFGLHHLGSNSVVAPELTGLLPVLLLWLYAWYLSKRTSI